MLRFISLALLGTALSAMAGFHYEAKTTITDEADKRANQEMIVEGWVDGTKAKILFRDSENPMTKPGSYLITENGGETLYLVDPEEKTYMEWDMDQLIQMAGAIGGMVNIEFQNFESKKLEESDGDRIHGYDTRRIKTETSYDLNIRMMGMRRTSSVETEQTVWIAEKLKDVAFGVWLRKTPPSSGNEELDKLMRSAIQDMEGFPLRSETKSVTRQWNKKRTKVRRESTSYSKTEVTRLDKTSIPGETFEIPAGYTETANPLSGEGNPLGNLFKQR